MFQSRSNKQKTDFLNSIYIASPCEVQWKDMDGSDQVRFCKSCKKNVFNISAMSTNDAVKLLTENTQERPCVKLYKRADGTLITDNCPVGLRKARERCLKVAAKILFFIGLSVLAQKVQAQGLVGAPVDPRYGQSGEVGGGLGDYGYDTARDVCHLLTMASIPAATIFGFSGLRKTKKKAIRWYRRGASRRIAKMLVRRKIWQVVAFVVCVPILVHIIGTLWLNWGLN